MRVLLVQNTPEEGPGTIGEFLERRHIPSDVVLMSRTPLTKPEGYTHVVVMGGPMGVYEMDEYPFLEAEAELLRRAIEEEKAVLGVCLGAQMIAHVLGARVYRGSVSEIGWYQVNLTPQGRSDPVFGKMAAEGEDAYEVFQWHSDTFDLPEGAVLLASSEAYPNQAFRYGRKTYALQFHVEMTHSMISEWLEGHDELDAASILDHAQDGCRRLAARADAFYRAFFNV